MSENKAVETGICSFKHHASRLHPVVLALVTFRPAERQWVVRRSPSKDEHGTCRRMKAAPLDLHECLWEKWRYPKLKMVSRREVMRSASRFTDGPIFTGTGP